MRRRKEIKTDQSKNLRRVTAFIVMLILAGIPLGYGKYLEFGSKDPFDGSLNIYSAQSILNGQKLFVDVVPSARPATLLVNIIGVALCGFSEFGPKLIQMLMQFTALVMLFYTLRKVYGFWPATVGVVLASFYLSCPPYAKFGNVKEQFMIACMIISACAVMLRYLGGRLWLMVLAGAVAINAYYFKPTGASVSVAIAVYVFWNFLSRQRSFRMFIFDFGALLAGAIVGLIPLSLFYLRQGQMKVLLGTPPIFALKLIMVIAVVGVVVYGFCRMVRPKIISVVGWDGWRTMSSGKLLFILAVSVIVVLVLIAILFFLSTPLNKFISQTSAGIRKISDTITKSSYLSGSREVTSFRAQYDTVIRYLSTFVIPIGMSLLAIFWWIARSVKRLIPVKINNDVFVTDETDQFEKQGDRFVLLLCVWWVLDMLFLWVSPRSYVQYYLPFNASSAMLAGYAMCRCIKKPSGFLWLLGVWMIVDLIMAWVVPGEGFAHIGFRSAALTGPYWGRFTVLCVVLVVAVCVYVFMSRKKFKRGTGIILGLVCCGMFFLYNTANLSTFGKRVGKLRATKAQGLISEWERAGRYIRQNSSQDDGLYVWGWLPGVYIESQRFSPTMFPSYSDMHAEQPKMVRSRIDRLVRELSAQKPLYIVDSQKMHYPYNTHPVFDLWPEATDKRTNKKQFLPADLNTIKQFSDNYNDYVERYTRTMLTHPDRPGGAMAQDNAEQLAQTERQRHEKMFALREFVMTNYKVVGKFGGHILFKRKDAHTN